jgi:hypothetical protein
MIINIYFRGILCALLFLLWIPAAYSFAPADSLLRELSQTIENRELYINEKQDRIAFLRNRLADEENSSLSEKFDIYDAVYNEYRSFKYDSAFAYALKLQETARKLEDPAKINYSKLQMGFTLLSSGMFKEAFDSLKTVEVKELPKNLRVDYYELMARAFYDLAGYNVDAYYANRYVETGNLYADSAISLSDEDTQQFHYLKGMKSLKERDFKEAKKKFQLILDEFRPTEHKYAIVASTLAGVYIESGEPDKAINLMIKAAIADVKSSTTEALALINLANLLYTNGKEELAYAYIKQALNDAEFYGAKQRKIQASAILPIIEGERLARVESERSRLLVYAIAVSLLSLLVIAFAFIIFKQLKQLRQAKRTVTEANVSLQEANEKLQETNSRLQLTNDKLLEANRIKEEYIGYSFNMYTEYIEKIEKIKKDVNRKLRANKFREVCQVMDSINLKKEREVLYLNFDKIFLRLFPNFVSAFNSFFKEEDRICPNDNGPLNIELRIFALIRIGIHDHEQIASILEYSVRTIYNYKTKVKNRSILSNEEFEGKVMVIKAF